MTRTSPSLMTRSSGTLQGPASTTNSPKGSIERHRTPQSPLGSALDRTLLSNASPQSSTRPGRAETSPKAKRSSGLSLSNIFKRRSSARVSRHLTDAHDASTEDVQATTQRHSLVSESSTAAGQSASSSSYSTTNMQNLSKQDESAVSGVEQVVQNALTLSQTRRRRASARYATAPSNVGPRRIQSLHVPKRPIEAAPNTSSRITSQPSAAQMATSNHTADDHEMASGVSAATFARVEAARCRFEIMHQYWRLLDICPIDDAKTAQPRVGQPYNPLLFIRNMRAQNESAISPKAALFRDTKTVKAYVDDVELLASRSLYRDTCDLLTLPQLVAKNWDDYGRDNHQDEPRATLPSVARSQRQRTDQDSAWSITPDALFADFINSHLPHDRAVHKFSRIEQDRHIERHDKTPHSAHISASMSMNPETSERPRSQGRAVRPARALRSGAKRVQSVLHRNRARRSSDLSRSSTSSTDLSEQDLRQEGNVQGLSTRARDNPPGRISVESSVGARDYGQDDHSVDASDTDSEFASWPPYHTVPSFGRDPAHNARDTPSDLFTPLTTKAKTVIDRLKRPNLVQIGDRPKEDRTSKPEASPIARHSFDSLYATMSRTSNRAAGSADDATSIFGEPRLRRLTSTRRTISQKIRTVARPSSRGKDEPSEFTSIAAKTPMMALPESANTDGAADRGRDGSPSRPSLITSPTNYHVELPSFKHTRELSTTIESPVRMRQRSRSSDSSIRAGLRPTTSKRPGPRAVEPQTRQPLADESKGTSNTQQQALQPDGSELHQDTMDSGSKILSSSVSKSDIAWLRALLLSSGVKASCLVRLAACVDIRSSPPSDAKGFHANATVSSRVRLLQDTLIRTTQVIDEFTSEKRAKQNADLREMRASTAETLTNKLWTFTESADVLIGDINTRQTLSIKQVNDNIDNLLRLQAREYRWLTSAGYVLLGWLVLGIMWCAWLVVVALRVVRWMLNAVFVGIAWLLRL